MPKKPLLSIGMAVHTDYQGAYFTLSSFRLHHNEVLKDIEFVIINNKPDNADGQAVRELGKPTSWVNEGCHGVRYHEFTEYDSTSKTRNLIFEHATADHVLVTDCHVLFEQGSIAKLIQHYKENPQDRNLNSGPLRYDDLIHLSTHFTNTWGGHMWGQWAQAWACSCGEGVHFDCAVRKPMPGQPPRVMYRKLHLDATPINSCFKCKKSFPKLIWHNHEQPLMDLGYT